MTENKAETKVEKKLEAPDKPKDKNDANDIYYWVVHRHVRNNYGIRTQTIYRISTDHERAVRKVIKLIEDRELNCGEDVDQETINFIRANNYFFKWEWKNMSNFDIICIEQGDSDSFKQEESNLNRHLGIDGEDE